MAAEIRNPGTNKFSQLSRLRTSDVARPTVVPIRASSPQSCVTDAFSIDTTLWPPDGRIGAWVHGRPDPHPWSVSSCVAEAETLNDRLSSSCTATQTAQSSGSHWTMATASAMSNSDGNGGGGGDKVVVVVGHDCSHEDSGKEVAYSPVLPLVHCRIDSVLAPHGFPEFMPDDDDEPEDPDHRQHRFCRAARAREHRLCPPPAPAPIPAEEAVVPERKPLVDAMTISRQLMAQEWTETPPMRLDMAKLAVDNGQRLPWLTPPVSANERPRKQSRSPLRWRFW